MTEHIARFKPGVSVPGFASTAVAAGTFVQIADDKTAYGDYDIEPCAAALKAFGVAEVDSAAATEPAHSAERRVAVTRTGAIARVVAGAAVTAGDEVEADANAKAVPLDAGVANGLALQSATDEDDVIDVALY